MKLKAVCVLLVLAFVPVASAQFFHRDCPDFSIRCLMVWDPVICDNGQVYSNSCVATYWGCATGCVPYGGEVMSDEVDEPVGLPVVERERSVIDQTFESEEMTALEPEVLWGGDCPNYDINCPALYAPVICDNGRVYSNLCVATYFGCATGCVPWHRLILAADGVSVTSDELMATESLEFESAEAGEPQAQWGGDCPNYSIMCPMVYDPVICDDGQTYSNLCVATYWGCATGCVRTGPGPIEISFP